jgi:predicted Zn-dependent protease
MKTFVLLLVSTLFLFGAAGPLHIKAAADAYASGKEALRQGQAERGIGLLRQAINIEPTFTEAFECLAAVYLTSGRRLEAAAVLTQLLEFEPNATASRLLLGQILLKERQPRRALAQFSLALKGDPFNADALFGFASAARLTGLGDRASEAMERGKKLYPMDARFQAAERTRNPQ